MEMKVFGHPYLSMVFQFSTVLSSDQPKWFSGLQGRNQLFISGEGNSQEISFDDVIMLTKPWYNFFSNGHR